MRRGKRENSKTYLLIVLSVSLLSGVLYFLSQPKFNIFPFAFLFVLPAHIYWRKTGDIKVFFFSGFFSFFFTVHWITHAITHYGGFPYIFALLPLSLLSAVLGFFVFIFGLARELISKWGRNAIPFSVIDPVIWVATEYIKSFIFTGFPWALVGYSLWEKTTIIQIADITGIYGVSFLVMSGAGLICDVYDFLSKRKEVKTLALSSIFVSWIFALSAIYGVLRKAEIDDFVRKVPHSLPAVVVQPSIPQDVKWTPELKRRALMTNIKLTFSALDKPYRNVLAVWPETALTFYLNREPELKEELISLAKKGFFIIAGGLGYEENPKRFYNRAYLITPDGEIFHYDKTHLVIFGEYIPLRWLLEKIPFVKRIIEEVEQVSGDFSPGRVVSSIGDEKLKVAVPICFESIFPSLVRKMVVEGGNSSNNSTSKVADIIAVITNDGWFGLSSGPYQHFSVSAFRAVEMRRFVLRSANTGISGAFSPTGEVMKKTKLLERTSFLVMVKPLKIKTFYMMYGDVFALLCLFLSLVLVGISYIRHR